MGGFKENIHARAVIDSPPIQLSLLEVFYSVSPHCLTEGTRHLEQWFLTFFRYLTLLSKKVIRY